MADLKNLPMDQKIQWLKSQGVPDQVIQQRLGQQAMPTPTPQPTPQKSSSLLNSPTVPATTGILGALIGSIIGPGGTVAGAGLGTMGGRIGQESLQDIFGKQDEEPIEKVASTAKEGASSAIMATLGELFGLGTGALGKFIFRGGQTVPQKVAENSIKKGTDPILEMIKGGFKGKPEKILSKAGGAAEKAWSTIKALAKNKGDAPALTYEQLDDVAQRALEKAPLGESGSIQKAVVSILDDIKKRFGTEYTVDSLVEINKLLNSSLFKSGTKTTSQAAKMLVRDQLDDLVRSTVRQASPELSSALDMYGIYKDISSIALKSAAKGVKGNPVKNPLGVISLPFRFLTNPTTSSYVGSGLFNAGKVLTPSGGAAGAGLSPYLMEQQ